MNRTMSSRIVVKLLFTLLVINTFLVLIVQQSQATGYNFKYSPSAVANGMGETASLIADAGGVTANPALAAFLMDSTGIELALNNAIWWPNYRYTNYEYGFQGIFGVVDGGPIGFGIPGNYMMGIGLHQYKQKTIPNTNTYNTSVPSTERYRSATFSGSIRSLIDIGIGFTYNHYTYEYPGIEDDEKNGSSANIGVYARWRSPELPLTARGPNVPKEETLTGQFIPAVSYSSNNITLKKPGESVDFNRHIRYGFSAEVILRYKCFPILSFLYTNELMRDKEARYYDNLKDETHGIGYQVDVLNTFEWRTGAYHVPDWSYNGRDNNGYTIKTDGVFTLLKRRCSQPVPNYILNHFSFEFTESRWDFKEETDEGFTNPLYVADNTYWRSLTLRWYY